MLTTTEVVRMIRKSGIVFDRVEIEAADVPFGIGSGSGVIFGVTGCLLYTSWMKIIFPRMLHTGI